MPIIPSKIPIFGLDIGSYTAKAAQVQYRRDGIELYAASIIDLPNPEKALTEKNKKELTEAIKKAIDSSKPHRINTKKVVSALPESKVYTEVISVPEMKEEELRAAVPLEASKRMPLTPETSYIDYSVIGKTRDKKLKLLTVGAPKSLVEFYYDLIKSCGLELVTLETKPIAAIRSLLSEEMKSKNIMIVDIGANNSSITIVVKESIRVAITISSGGEAYIKAAIEALKLSREKALKMAELVEKDKNLKDELLRVLFPLFEDIVERIQKAVEFFQSKSPDAAIDGILLTGGGAITPGLKDYIQENTNIATQIADPFINIKSDIAKEIPKGETSSLVTAIGLALRRVEE